MFDDLYEDEEAPAPAGPAPAWVKPMIWFALAVALVAMFIN